MDIAIIRKVREPFGILGNMSRHSVNFGGLRWHTTEALFQALRFSEDSPIRDLIRAEKNPMRAKFVAKSHIDEMVIQPCSSQDLENMKMVLELKLQNHQDVREVLESTRGMTIIEDCTSRQRGSGLFWGAARKENGSWEGENWLGVLWMGVREAWPK